MDAVIQTHNLTKFYGKARGVIDLDLDVPAGEVFGFLGPNGAGKTTAIRLLMDFIRPTRGSISIFGLDAHRDSLAIRKRVGNLPGEWSLYGNLTGEEVLRYLAGLRKNVDWSFVRRLAERLQADLSRPTRTYSHGNKQKIGLIAAFMAQADLMILDEPTTGLDPLMQQEFYQLVAEVKAEGRTVFLSSHILPEVERTCDRVGIIRAGQLVAVESIAAIKAKSLRRVEIRFASAVPRAAFESIPGVRDLHIANSRLTCTLAGEMDALVKTAAQQHVIDFEAHQANLEDVFLAFYEKEANHAQ
ncbi:MAG TPA: ABC transporter ATP-binding protein [Anaerolineae bacterium]|nr:ABC transporter ATP-binding protein [Anaerolineae bacterium]